jgi:tetratricopeptide (TPR) repeat protein
VKAFAIFIILGALLTSPLFGQTGASTDEEKITDAVLLKLLDQRATLKEQMTTANEKGDYDKYKELETQWNDLDAKIKARQDLITSSKKEAKRLVDNAGGLLRDKKYPQAQANYEKALTYKEFLDSNVLLSIKARLAYCLERQKLYPRALEIYSEIIEANPQDPDAYAGKGRVLSGMGKDSEAVNFFQKALEIEPDKAEHYFFLAECYVNIQMMAEAETNYQLAVQKDSKYFKAFYQLGVLRFKMQKYNEAIDALKASVAINKNYPKAYALIAQIYNTIGNYPAALDAAESAINLQVNYTQAHFEKGIALYKSERYNQALDAFEKCLNDREWRDQANWHINLIKEKYLSNQ